MVKQKTRKITSIVFVLSTIIFIVILFRALGWFQFLEWKILDMFFKMRPSEASDERIVIVKITEEDIKTLRYPISDKHLAEVLNKIKSYHPRSIGLDIVRDNPVDPGHQELIKVFTTTPYLWGIEKTIGRNFNEKIDPPPLLKKLNQVGSTDTILDKDAVVRRTLLYPRTQDEKFLPNLGLAVAMTYLEKQNIDAITGKNNYLQLNRTLFVPFQADSRGQSNAGGYVDLNAGGYQILLNYRGKSNTFNKVSTLDVLRDKVPPNFFTGRIVLIGYDEAASVKDEFLTPYSSINGQAPVYTSGVEINANIASTIISSVLDDRPLLKTSNELLEYLLIIFTSGILPLLIYKVQKENINLSVYKYLFMIVTASSLSCLGLIGGSYLAFLNSWWIPVGIPITGLVFSTVIVVGHTLSRKTYQSYSLAIKNERRMNLAISAAEMETFEWNLEKGLITISDNLNRLSGNENKLIAFNKDELFNYINFEDRSKVELEIQKGIKNKTDYNFEFRMSKIGEDIWVKVKGSPIFGVGEIVTEINGLVWDISELKKLEIRADEIDRRWKTLTKNINEFIIVIRSDDWLINHLNISVKELLGHPRNNVLMTSFLRYVSHKDKNLIVKKIKKLLPEEKFTLIYYVKHKDGSLRAFESTFCNLMKDRLINGILINSHDVTELVEAKLNCGNMASRFEEIMKSPD